jgi:hypothetical protein
LEASLSGEKPLLEPVLEAVPGRCLPFLKRLGPAGIRDLVADAAHRRAARKAALLLRSEEWHGAEEAMYQAIAGALGYERNQLPFTLLAQRLPLRTLADAGSAAEALLFGVSGLLEATGSGHLQDFGPETGAYLRGLWEHWWPLRSEWQQLTLDPSLWRMSGQRPANHPLRRLAALAVLVSQWNAFRRVRRTAGFEELPRFFAQLRHPFWEHHYTLASRRCGRPLALVGATRVEEIVSNIFLPLALARGKTALPKRGGSATVNRRIWVVCQRLFGATVPEPDWLRDPMFQQGLLQLYEDFCLRDVTGCRNCPMPEQLAKRVP